MQCAASRLLRSGVATVAGVLVLVLAQSGLARPPGAGVKVTPAVGGPRTVFLLSFTSPVRTGVIGSIRLRYLLTAAIATPGKRCLAQISAPVPDARRGERVRVRLSPELLGGRWCAGSYHGSVRELQTAVCPPGTMCPTYVRLVGTVARFLLLVHTDGPTGTDLVAPTFAGLMRAFACTPGPQRPGQTTPFTLSWQAASDNVTPAAQISYDIYFAGTSGGEDFTKPTWTAPPGATGFRTPGLPSHGDAYFVVRARDNAGNEDTNTREQRGIDPCA